MLAHEWMLAISGGLRKVFGNPSLGDALEKTWRNSLAKALRKRCETLGEALEKRRKSLGDALGEPLGKPWGSLGEAIGKPRGSLGQAS